MTVNDVSVLGAGMRVRPGDLVKLDDKKQHWYHLQHSLTPRQHPSNTLQHPSIPSNTLQHPPNHRMGRITAQGRAPAKRLENRKLVYLKYWKPRGVTSTSDRNIPSNIIAAGRFELFPQRLFTVGRLDKDSTGLILLTSDGRLNNALLDPRSKKPKRYDVLLNVRPSDEHLQALRNGVVITTPVQRENGRSRDVTARTLPCEVKHARPEQASCTRVEFTLTEGRNRQIRRMCETLGYEVLALHRTRFAGIELKGLGENEWLELTDSEMKVITNAMGLG